MRKNDLLVFTDVVLYDSKISHKTIDLQLINRPSLLLHTKYYLHIREIPQILHKVASLRYQEKGEEEKILLQKKSQASAGRKNILMHKSGAEYLSKGKQAYHITAETRILSAPSIQFFVIQVRT